MPIYNPPTASAGSGITANNFDANSLFVFGRGTRTWTVPAGVNKVFVGIVGAGGSGARIANSITKRAATGGGGGGFAGAVLDVTAGDVYTIALGAGGLTDTTAGVNGAAGQSSEFKTAGGVALLTANGGSGGKTAVAPSNYVRGGAGGSSSVDTSVSTYVLTNGGRGGTIWYESEVSGFYLSTGGGASGWLPGDGGHGGDIHAFGAYGDDRCTGGGGWAGGNGGAIISDHSTASAYAATGGGGFLFDGGGGFHNTTGTLSGGGCGLYPGTGMAAAARAADVSGYQANAASTNNDYYVRPETAQNRFSWWRILTGEALLNAHTGTLNRPQPPGCGASGQNVQSRAPGIGGGEGAYGTSRSVDQTQNQTLRIGGGGGGSYFYASTSAPFANAAAQLVSKTDTQNVEETSMIPLIMSAPLGGGGGSCIVTTATSLPVRGGDGFCVICW